MQVRKKSVSEEEIFSRRVGAVCGASYVGEFKDGKMHGLGKYTFANGTVYHDGEWENGEPKK